MGTIEGNGRRLRSDFCEALYAHDWDSVPAFLHRQHQLC